MSDESKNVTDPAESAEPQDILAKALADGPLPGVPTPEEDAAEAAQEALEAEQERREGTRKRPEDETQILTQFVARED